MATETIIPSAPSTHISDLVRVQIERGCWRAASFDKVFDIHSSGLTWSPRFVVDHKVIKCLHEHVLGFYVLVSCARSVFRAVNCFTSGLLLPVSFYAPSVGLFYTSAYHSLHAMLALEGRAIFDSPSWEEDAKTVPAHAAARKEYPEAVIAILTKNNKWLFEPRKRGHTQRWQEICQVFSSERVSLPPCFESLFQAAYSGRRFRKGVPLGELLKNPESHRVKIKEVLRDFLSQIAMIRHMAFYEGLGVDPGALDAMANSESVSEDAVRSRSDALAQFAFSMLDYVAANLHCVVHRIPSTRNLQERLAHRIHYPWVDDPVLDAMPDSQLKETLKALNKWFAI